ncbi:MAG: hypothetical protein ACYDG2_15905 [Ruminiclostridium sp.]
MATLRIITESKIRTEEYSATSSEELEVLERILGKKNNERYLECLSSGTLEDKEFTKGLYTGIIIECKRILPYYLKRLNSQFVKKAKAIENIKEIKRDYPLRETAIKVLEYILSSTDEFIEEYKNVLSYIGGVVITSLEQYSKFNSDRDFAQLISADEKDVERYRQDYNEKHKDDQSQFFISLILEYKAENSSKSACNKDKPLLEAMNIAMRK